MRGFCVIGAPGFEPGTSVPQTSALTRLRHAPWGTRLAPARQSRAVSAARLSWFRRCRRISTTSRPKTSATRRARLPASLPRFRRKPRRSAGTSSACRWRRTTKRAGSWSTHSARSSCISRWTSRSYPPQGEVARRAGEDPLQGRRHRRARRAGRGRRRGLAGRLAPFAEALVQPIDERRHLLEALRDHAQAVLAEMLRLDVQCGRERFDDLVRGTGLFPCTR